MDLRCFCEGVVTVICRQRALRGLLVASAVVVALTSGVRPTSAQDCHVSYAGLDSSKWDTSDGPSFGQAIGQTFYAADTVISAVTVWRPPGYPSTIGAKLYITG